MELQKEPVGDLQLHQVLRMNEGNGDNSYSNNSLLQKKVILQAKPILQETIVQLYSKEFPRVHNNGRHGVLFRTKHFPANMGGNDFNSIFRSLPSFHKKLEEEMGGRFGPCFIAAMPGSFYGRLFPPRSLHFVHSSYSLHWLSEVQEIPLNKGNIYLAKTSPPGVHKAYLNQFEKRLHSIFKMPAPPSWEFLGMMLNDMVLEGLIEESKLDSFNLPIYAALAEEVRDVIRAERSFTITRLESFHVSWDSCIDDRCRDTMDKYTKGKNAAKQESTWKHSRVRFTNHVVSMIKA
ncbi:hypothetical protein OIU84_016811 [Salix udensis]|uniref:Jasmonate O-methyltransferase n=1 Tax=Salix udensis TaxID=889485 RepID=A0AAD6JB92_9ROSI|nr:hypothetical protein OIU84_016811 [Salix udensis]